MILVSPTAFKGTLTVRDVARAMAAGASAVASGLEVRVVPLSDGGNGLLTALESAAGGKGHAARVSGPLGTSVTARYLVQEDRAVVETAEACGLHLAPTPLRDPGRASTRGVGELLLAAAETMEQGPLVVGLGGSATVDAGSGMVTALGWRLLDASGTAIPPGARGLLELHAIESDEPVTLPELVVLADVWNPLLGDRGAAPVYAPQKGARPDDIPIFERGLERWADVVRRDLGRDVAALPGAGAAGGLGAAFAAFLDAAPRLGAGWILDAVGYEALLDEADVMITGEGAWDEQSSMGKVTGEVLELATARGVPVLLVVGSAEGSVPGTTKVVSGDGAPMDADEIRERVKAALPGLLAQRRRR